jgi:hypothetical protein
VLDAPLRALSDRNLVEARGDVDRRLDPDLVAGLDLQRQQVADQVRVALADAGVVIAVAVVALGEQRHAVDVPDAQHLLELPLVKNARRHWECGRTYGSRGAPAETAKRWVGSLLSFYF